MNRTSVFVTHSLRLYSGIFQFLSSITDFKQANFYIGHKTYSDEYNNHIFIQIEDLEGEVADLEGYVTHYPYKAGWVLIFKCPVEGLIKNFLLGKYSQMYTIDQMKLLFGRNMALEDVRKVLTRSQALRIKIERELDVRIDPDAELASPPKIEEEVLEYVEESIDELLV